MAANPLLLPCIALLLTTSSSASADTQECISQSEGAQQARSDGHLRTARDLFHQCAASECPSSIRSDCERSFDEVDRAIPSVVVIVRSAGADVTEARVVVDGLVIADKIDGRALPIDPGPHHLRIESPARALLDERDVTVHVAEKNRVLEFNLATRDARAPVQPQGVERHHTAAPWVVMGIGVALAAAGGILLAVGETQIAQSTQGCVIDTTTGAYLNCAPPPVPSRMSENQTGIAMGDIGAIGLAVGGVAILTGLVWHFAEPTHQRVAILPSLSPQLAGLRLHVTF